MDGDLRVPLMVTCEDFNLVVNGDWHGGGGGGMQPWEVVTKGLGIPMVSEPDEGTEKLPKARCAVAGSASMAAAVGKESNGRKKGSPAGPGVPGGPGGPRPGCGRPGGGRQAARGLAIAILSASRCLCSSMLQTEKDAKPTGRAMQTREQRPHSAEGAKLANKRTHGLTPIKNFSHAHMPSETVSYLRARDNGQLSGSELNEDATSKFGAKRRESEGLHGKTSGGCLAVPCDRRDINRN